MSTVALVIAAYVVGSVPVAYLVGRWRGGVDVRTLGTGNPGAANVWRNVGWVEGAGVALFCAAQGAWPALAARCFGVGEPAAGLCGLAAVAGNCWPAFLGFKGGRGVAASLGLLGALWPLPTAALLILFGLGLLVDHFALSVLVGFAALPIWLWLRGESATTVGLAAAVFGLLLARRLSGIGSDFGAGRSRRSVLAERLLHDRRPGQRLVGPRRPE